MKNPNNHILSEPAIIRSLDELKVLCDEWGNPAYDDSSEEYSSQTNLIIGDYDDDFFKEKALVINSFSGNESLKISSVRVDETQLIVNIVRKRGTFNDGAKNMLFIIEIKKADIKGVTTSHMEIKNKR